MKHILVLCLLLFSYSTLIAQQKLGVKSVISASASKRENLGQNLTIPVNGVSTNFTISSVSMQVGMVKVETTKIVIIISKIKELRGAKEIRELRMEVSMGIPIRVLVLH